MSNETSLHYNPLSPIRLQRLLPLMALLCLGFFAACDAAEDPKGNPPGQEQPECGPESESGEPCDNDGQQKPDCGPESESGEPCDNNGEGQGDIELAGTYDTVWGSIHEIDNESWDNAAVIAYDNEKRVAVVQYPENDPYNPNKFDLNAWVPSTGGSFWYCSLNLGAASAEDVEDIEEAELPDSSKPAEAGCGGFPWTELNPRDPIEVKGVWSSEWADETITSRRWEWVSIVDYDNEIRETVVQNDPDEDGNPGLFSRIVWTPIVDEAFYYCYVTFDQESAEEAWAAEGDFDDSDPENGGCGGFTWTRLERKAAN